MLSGVSALTYEVIWVRLLGDLFGHTAYAVQAVLAVFFGGIALGSYLCDRINPEARDLLKVYAAIEIFVGVAGLLFPLAINLLTSFYDTHAPLVSESGVALRFRLAVASLILIYFTPAVSERLGTLIGFGFVRRGILLESLVSAFILLCPTLCLGVIFPLLLDVARRRSLVAPLDRGLAEIDTAAVRIGYVSKQEGTWILDSWGIIPMLRTFSRNSITSTKVHLRGRIDEISASYKNCNRFCRDLHRFRLHPVRRQSHGQRTASARVLRQVRRWTMPKVVW